jgi:GTPase
MNCHHEVRILAFDVRRSRFGYALFEGPKRLLDWGASAIAPGSADSVAIATVRKRIAFLLKIGLPTVVVVKQPRRNSRNDASTRASIVKAILREAAACQIPVRFIDREEIQQAFRIFRGSTKDEIAATLVDIFPELLARLPPPRKVWQTEHHAMIVFDAIATGFAYWQRNGAQPSLPEGA